MSKRLKNFLRQIENEMSEPTEEELEYIYEEVKQYICNGIMPQSMFAKQLAFKIAKMTKYAAISDSYPTMPSDHWMAEHGTRSQESDRVDHMP